MPVPYSAVAREYYNAVRHPTCANFGDLSEQFLTPRLKTLLSSNSKVLEVGAGRSIVAPIMAEKLGRLDNLTLLDSSIEMLEYSRSWKPLGATFVVAEACKTALAPNSFDFIVSSLGDPYNCSPFWLEMRRIIASGGLCLFTTPAPGWVAWFRKEETMDQAEFLLDSGATVVVPSFILAKDRQRAVFRTAGWEIVESATYSAQDVKGPLSPKVIPDSATTNPTDLLDGYLLRLIQP